MATDRTERHAWQTALACGIVGVICLLLPNDLQTPLRGHFADLLVPGQRIAKRVSTSLTWQTELAGASADAASIRADLAKRLEQLELHVRQQQVREARLQKQLADRRQHGDSPFVAAKTTRLVRHELVEARVLGREKDLDQNSAIMVDLGSDKGAVSHAFVVRGTGPVLDVGSAANVAEGQPVYCGRCVIGRIERTGRVTSAVRLITDPGYTGRAQLLRRTERGSVFGAEGILVGMGDGNCRLRGIPYTEPVRVGDDVYTGGRSARLPEPMYYGRVVSANLVAGQRWEIVVEPRADFARIDQVSVLRQSLRAPRVLGQ